MGKIDEILKNNEYINRRSLAGQFDEAKYIQMVDEHNRKFIYNKLKELEDYFDHLYDKINPSIKLDLNQKIAILTNEDYNLIIAGAGSGKTTTMIGKIKYLIDQCNVLPDEILTLSFSKKNVEELDEKLNKILNLGVNVQTFHKLGLDIIREKEQINGIIDDSVMYNIFREYFEKVLFQNKKDLKTMTLFLNCFFNIGSEMDSFDSLQQYHEHICNELRISLKGKFELYNEQVIQKRSAYRRTINSEYVRSNEELSIANFLFLNGIDYEYEKRYIHGDNNKIYRPDFTLKQGENTIYLEHFGINENGTSSYYSVNDTIKYNHNINLKKQAHARYGTKLLCTFSKYNDNRPMLLHLQEELQKNGFVFKTKTPEEIFQTLTKTSSDRYFYDYYILASEFLKKFKLYNLNLIDIDNLVKMTNSDRTKLFLMTVKPFIAFYQKYSFEHHIIDFDDMIIKSINILNNNQYHPIKTYKYLIVDEYQDISKQRFELIKRLSEYYSSYIVAVGDDWQSIFSFAGSDVELFTHFQESLGYAEELKIVNTYRNAQELIDIAGEFVQKDDGVIKKDLKATKHIDKPIVVYSYDDQTDKNLNIAVIVANIIKNLYTQNPNENILLIGRYNHDINKLFKTEIFYYYKDRVVCKECPKAKISFTTAHKSKGLEDDNVIIINAIDATYGFPSKVKDDPIFDVFPKKEENYAYAEERRLFYVAITRTKNKVYILVPKSKPSPFVLELVKNNHVEFKDDIEKEYSDFLDTYKCPKCGNKLIKTHIDNLNSLVYSCSSDSELCDFMTTSLQYKISLKPCPKCNGYLVPKDLAKNGNLIIGCTNYKQDGSGCNYIEFLKNTC